MVQLLILFLLFLSVFPFLKKEKYNFFFMCFVLTLSCLSYYMNVDEASDLYRHFDTIRLYREVGWEWIWDNRMNLNPLTHIYFYLFTFTDEHLFPVFSVFITYYFTLKLFSKFVHRYGLKRVYSFLLFFGVISNLNYMLIVSNCRLFMLYAIVSYAIYLDLVEHKYIKLAFLIYFLSPFFHYGILPVLLCRFLLSLSAKFNISDTFLILFIFILALIYAVFLPFVSEYSLFSSMSDKLISYNTEYTGFGTWQYLNSISLLLLTLFCSAKYYFTHHEIVAYNSVVLYIICSIVFVLGQLNSFQLVYRSSNYIIMLAVIPLSLLITSTHRKIRSCRQLLVQLIAVQAIYSFVYNFVYVYKYISFSF